MPQSATIESLPAAFRMMKAMQAEGVEWGEDYRTAARAALKEVLEARATSRVPQAGAKLEGRADAAPDPMGFSSDRRGNTQPGSVPVRFLTHQGGEQCGEQGEAQCDQPHPFVSRGEVV